MDLAFLPTVSCDPYEVFSIAQELASHLGRDVDLSRASAVMRGQVVSTGKRLLVTDEQGADEFEMYALSDYARCNEERREVLKNYGVSFDV